MPPAVPGASIAPSLAPPATAPPATAPPPTGDATPTAPQPQGSARVYFSPASVDTSVGQNFSVTLVLDGGTDVAAAPMIAQFDPKFVKLNDIVQGDLFTAGGKAPVFAKNIQNDSGRASIQLNVAPSDPGVTIPSGRLVTLSFQAVAPGSSNIFIPFLTVRNSQGQPIATSSPKLTVNVK